jgi:hypothetical protein
MYVHNEKYDIWVVNLTLYVMLRSLKYVALTSLIYPNLI